MTSLEQRVQLGFPGAAIQRPAGQQHNRRPTTVVLVVQLDRRRILVSDGDGAHVASLSHSADTEHSSGREQVSIGPLAGEQPPASPTIGGKPGCDDPAVSRSVLVVDDDASFRHLVARILSSWGHVVVGEAGGVTEALTRALELHPDTVLVDIGLPDGDGLDLARELRAMPWPLRIVIVSIDAEAASEPE